SAGLITPWVRGNTLAMAVLRYRCFSAISDGVFARSSCSMCRILGCGAMREMSQRDLRNCRRSSHIVGAVRTVVGSTCIRSSRFGSQFLDLGSDRAEWTESVLLCRKSVCIRAVGTIDRLLQPDRIILVEVSLLRPIL